MNTQVGGQKAPREVRNVRTWLDDIDIPTGQHFQRIWRGDNV